MEVCFRPIGRTGLWERLNFPIVGFVALGGFVVYYVYLRLVFRGLRSGLSMTYPWRRAVEERTTEQGADMSLTSGAKQQRTVPVDAAPILTDDGAPRGDMATFDNLTLVEKKNAHLRKLLHKLKSSRAIIHQQNQTLRTLATRDPLTDCLNRRALFEVFESQWSSSERFETPLSCIMVDIDYFKSINDKHGHATGDLVLQHVARTLSSIVRKSDFICRYGGEEFCILLPQIDLDGALMAAQRLRLAIEAQVCAGIKVTASLGVSALSLGAPDPRELINQADIALYASKRQGRNRVTYWSHELQHMEKGAPDVRHALPNEDPQPGTKIPFHAVTALVSALVYRHVDTAEHSRRVADLCVAAANGLMSQSDCYVLEVAGLLHDIGKLGVPDAVLLKAGALNAEEFKAIRTHEAMGAAIISSAFSCDQLTEIISKYRCCYGGTPQDPALPRGDAIPLCARLLCIADAYDAIVSDKVYRKGKTRGEAFAELRRCAGVQFDPELVEHFIGVVLARNDSRTPPTLNVSKQTALKVGVQIEKLAYALDTNDYGSLALMASHLDATASTHNIPPIAAAAARLKKSAAARDQLEITRTTIELLELCRATYRSYIPSASV